jgi:fructoselysine 6-phosphate deglycase
MRLFDHTQFFHQFETAIAQLRRAEEVGRELARQGVRRLYLVGCGAPLAIMRVIAYWAQQFSQKAEFISSYSAEFLHQNPIKLDENTCVILASHSGLTQETVDAGLFLKTKPAHKVVVTQDENSPLAKTGDEVLTYGKSEQGYYCSYLITQAFISAFLNECERKWTLHSALMDALKGLPAILADSKILYPKKIIKDAKTIIQKPLLYVVGAGPMFETAYVLATCFLMEMQWLHAHPLVAAEFFHGPLEVVDKNTSMIVLLGEDPHRIEAERVAQFCKTHVGNAIIYDSQHYEMTGVPFELRPLLAPFVIDAALTSLVEKIAELRQHPLTVRRYMGKVIY